VAKLQDRQPGLLHRATAHANVCVQPRAGIALGRLSRPPADIHSCRVGVNEITPSSRPQPSDANHFRGADDRNGRFSGFGRVRLGRIIENVSLCQGNAVMRQGKL
jgi:hypothetical protein